MSSSIYGRINDELHSIQENYINEIKDMLEDIENRIMNLKESLEKSLEKLDQLNIGDSRKILEETLKEHVPELEDLIGRIQEYLGYVEVKIEDLKTYIHFSK